MNEKKLIANLKQLQGIKPNQDWVLLTKNRLFLDEPEVKQRLVVSLFPAWKPALATVSFLLLLVGLFGFSFNSLPGDLLYPVKKVVEKSKTFLVSDKEQANLDLASRKLEDLAKVAETNQARRLPQAINEFQVSVDQVAKDLAQAEKINPETLQRVVNLGKEKEVIEQTLGAQISTTELDNTYKDLAEYFVADLRTRTLTLEQMRVLVEMEELIAEEEYASVLELLPLINQ